MDLDDAVAVGVPAQHRRLHDAVGSTSVVIVASRIPSAKSEYAMTSTTSSTAAASKASLSHEWSTSHARVERPAPRAIATAPARRLERDGGQQQLDAAPTIVPPAAAAVAGKPPIHPPRVKSGTASRRQSAAAASSARASARSRVQWPSAAASAAASSAPYSRRRARRGRTHAHGAVAPSHSAPSAAAAVPFEAFAAGVAAVGVCLPGAHVGHLVGAGCVDRRPRRERAAHGSACWSSR